MDVGLGRSCREAEEKVADRGHCDFVRDFAKPYPALMIATVVGAPLEDASESTTAASALTGGTPARFQDVSFGTDDTLPGADAVLTFNSATSRMQSTTFPAVNYSTGCSVMLMIKLDALPAAETILFQFASLGRVAVWRVTGGPLGYTMYGWDDDGVNVFTTPTYL